jgi:hypothetical protein
MADRFHRGRVTTVGSILYGLSFVGDAVTPVIEFAFVAAVLGGAGGALFLVALSARVCEGLAADYGAFRRLFSAEGAGTWIAFVAAMMRSRKSAIAAFSGLPQWLAPSRRFSYRDSSSTAFCPTICTRRCGGWDGHGCSAGLSFTPGPRCSR